MSKSHLNSINDLLKKKTLSQAQVEEIEMHFREMLDIQEVNDNRQGIINKRQNVFDEFQKQVNDEGTCVITLTPEELNPKGIRCQQTFAKQATEAAQAVNAWFRATAELSLNLYDILSDTWIDKYANTTDTTKKDKKQEAQAIEPHEPVDFLDTMERGESGYQGQVVHPTHEEESVTTASEQEEDEYLLLSTEYFDPNDVRSRSSTSSTTSTLTLASSGELDSNETVNLTLVIKEACDVLRAYLMDNDKEKFELLYEDMILVIHDISDNSGRTNIDKGAMMRRITALQAELDPSKFNFEGHGGLNDEQVTLWFRVKFWLCSTFKAILNAVGLRSAANFFTPAPSANEQNTINTNLQNLTNAVGQFKDTLNNTYPDPDSDSDADSGLDSNIRHS